MSDKQEFDLVIIGGGPAGIAAGVYASRGMLDCIILDSATLGGQLNWTQSIENYPGFTSIQGYELIEQFQKQIETLKIPVASFQEIQKVKLTDKIKTIETLDKTYTAKAVIICTGANPKKLGVPGEEKFMGRGVSYCAVCDGAFFKEKEICVIGGGNSAVEEGLYLTKFAKKVTIIHRRDQLRAHKSYQEKAFKNPKVNFIWDSVIEEIQGNEKGVNSIIIKNIKTNKNQTIQTDGVFPYIGTLANTDLVKNQVKVNDEGYITCDEKMGTNIAGVYAAGDIRNTPLRQIIVAAADGAIAATSSIKYIDEVFQTANV